MKALAIFSLTLVLAEGGPVNQGGFFLLGFLAAVVAAALGIRMARKRRCSIFSFIVCFVALFFSAELAYAFGLPYDWTYFGDYLPWFPLLLSIVGFVLTVVGALADYVSRERI